MQLTLLYKILQITVMHVTSKRNNSVSTRNTPVRDMTTMYIIKLLVSYNILCVRHNLNTMRCYVSARHINLTHS